MIAPCPDHCPHLPLYITSSQIKMKIGIRRALSNANWRIGQTFDQIDRNCIWSKTTCLGKQNA